jgi:hypothetical protein
MSKELKGCGVRLVNVSEVVQRLGSGGAIEKAMWDRWSVAW